MTRAELISDVFSIFFLSHIEGYVSTLSEKFVNKANNLSNCYSYLTAILQYSNFLPCSNTQTSVAGSIFLC